MLSCLPGQDEWLDVWLDASRAAADATNKQNEPGLWTNRTIAAADAALTVAKRRDDLAGAKIGLSWLREAVASIGMVAPTTNQDFQSMIDEAEGLVRRLS
jgi:hypothetical protein